ncbi:hypothetical protein EDB87DRAFT_824330 [Lactarius vividus]|nr:hypothetical protein EDB87DRAFT_824330 [Lactarius vividus]
MWMARVCAGGRTRTELVQSAWCQAAAVAFREHGQSLRCEKASASDLISASPVLPEVPQSKAAFFKIHEHTFVKTTFSKLVNCRVRTEPAKGAVLCSHCSLITHSKCAGRATLICDFRSKPPIHVHFAERGCIPAEFFTRLPNHHPAGGSSSQGNLDHDGDQRERERMNSPQLSPTSSPYPPISYEVFSSFS